MRYLYVFPHPDDESFGPASAMAMQLRQGHEVHLLTLTRGGATKHRHDFGFTVEQMGELRHREMLDVEKVLGLTSMTVLDMPDSGLKELDPRVIESTVATEIIRLRPDIVVTYAVFGVSGFEDHLVTHAVVKRAYVELREQHPWLRRLAFFTLDRDNPKLQQSGFGLRGSKRDEIDCVLHTSDDDVRAMHRALDAYVSYKETIDKSGVREIAGGDVCFEIYREHHDPPLSDLAEKLDNV